MEAAQTPNEKYVAPENPTIKLQAQVHRLVARMEAMDDRADEQAKQILILQQGMIDLIEQVARIVVLIRPNV